MSGGGVAPTPTLTVCELIARLQTMPPDALVSSEGCDCYGPVAGVHMFADGGVLVCRVGGDQFGKRAEAADPFEPPELCECGAPLVPPDATCPICELEKTR